MPSKPHKTVIIGSGPAAFTAGIYTARAALQPVLLTDPVKVGGELVNTTEVENYPGFPDGIMGPDLVAAQQAQAEKFGTEVVYDTAVSVALNADKTFTIETETGKQYHTQTVIYATGSTYNKLGLPNEEQLTGFGISYCATCDGFFFREKKVAVVGGGDTAVEEAQFLSKFADKVELLVRGEAMKASVINQNRVMDNPKVVVRYNTSVKEINPLNGSLETLTLDTPEGESVEEYDGLFIAIGSTPNTHLVHHLADLNHDGTILVNHPTTSTKTEGLFVAGDVSDGIYRQAVIAAGSGAKAALDVEAYLASL